MMLACKSLLRAPSLLAGLLFFLTVAPALAQESADLRGRVLLAGAGAPGVDVEVHRVTTAESGVVARTTTDAQGRFRLRLPPADSTGFTVYFATAEYGAVRHFGRPLHPSDDRSDYTVEVFDTTSTPARPVRVGRRDLVLLPHNDGSWEVNEIIRLRNDGPLTVVSTDGRPVAEVDLPEHAAAFEAGDGDAPTDQVQRMGNRALLLMPVLPGTREIFFRYRLPARPAVLALGGAIRADSMHLYVQQPAPRIEVAGAAPADIIQVDGDRFLQYATTGTSSEPIRVTWSAAGAAPVSPVVAGLAATLMVLLAGGAVALRNRRR
jgi:hypothetical protein